MQVVVLAAGTGTRLQPLTRDIPKPMVELAGKPIIWYVLTPLLKLPEVDDIIVVTGCQHDVLDLYIHQMFASSDKIRCLHHPAYDKGNLFTLLSAKALLHTTFMLTNADHIFRLALLSKFTQSALHHYQGAITIGCHRDRLLTSDDMKVQLEQEQMTNISKGLTAYDSGYLGLTLVPEPHLHTYFELVDATVKKQGENSVVEQVLLEAAQQGLPPSACDLTGLGWYEIDTPEDHAIAEQGLCEQGSATRWQDI